MRMIAGMFCWTVVRGFSSTIAITSNRAAFSSSTALDMARLRGLEKRRDGATPTGMLFAIWDEFEPNGPYYSCTK